jgi:hypothetical protein
MKQKHTSTHLLIFGLILSSSIVLFWTSCTDGWFESIETTKYFYINNSGHRLSITSYNYGRDSTYIINQNDTLEFSEEISTGSTFNNYLINDSDSVHILFGTTKRLIYTMTSISKRNIIFLANYEHLRIINDYGDHQYDWFEYYFTPDDYQNADSLINLP